MPVRPERPRRQTAREGHELDSSIGLNQRQVNRHQGARGTHLTSVKYNIEANVEKVDIITTMSQHLIARQPVLDTSLIVIRIMNV
jgi:hypothetical protein